MEQLYTRKVAKPVESSKLTKVQKLASLRYLMFMSKNVVGESRHADVLTDESNAKQ
jgi:hypothetical protein